MSAGTSSMAPRAVLRWPKPSRRIRVPTCVIARDARELDQLRAELGFFLGQKAGARRIHALPDWEVLPYDVFSPHPDIISERLSALAEMPRLRSAVILAAADTVGQRLAPRGYVDGRTFNLAIGDRLEIEPLRARLVESGYASVSQVTAPGEFALRGSLFDVFPMGTSTPLRVDLFDDEVEADPRVRRRDPALGRVAEAGTPAAGPRTAAGRGVRQGLPSALPQTVRRRSYAQRHLPGRERRSRAAGHRVLPAAVLRHHRHAAGLSTVRHRDLRRSRTCRPRWSAPRAAWPSATRNGGTTPSGPSSLPTSCILSPEELQTRLGQVHARRFRLLSRWTTKWSRKAPAATISRPVRRSEWRVDLRAERPLAPLEDFLDSFPGRVLLAADSAGRREVLLEMLRAHGLKPKLLGGLARVRRRPGSIRAHHRARDGGAARSPHRPSRCWARRSCSVSARARNAADAARNSDPQAILRDLDGAGPGLSRGSRRIWRGSLPRPAGHAGGRTGRRIRGARICRRRQALRAGPAAAPGLALLRRRARERAAAQAGHRSMGAGAQARRRQDPRRGRRAARSVRATPGEERARRCRRRNSTTRPSPTAFRSRKPPTRPRPSARCWPDLASEKPMDRVVCGDVGFGKTEVAMRAAFVAAQAGKQVVVLVPTTLLAEQHTNNFRDRFADWPVRIESLSRFRSGKEIQRGARGHRERHRRYCRCHAEAAARQRALQGSRAHHRRRGAPLRRARQGEAEDAARRSARADAHGHAHPAHAEHGAGRTARPVADHDAAGRAPRHQDFRDRVACAHAARSGAARVPARRPGLLRAQRGRDHREDRGRTRQADSRGRGAHRPRPDARARSRAADGRFLPPPLQPAGLHHHHRKRHRRAHGQHHHDRPRRPPRAGAAAPAARPRRPLAPPRLRLSAHAESQGVDRWTP